MIVNVDAKVCSGCKKELNCSYFSTNPQRKDNLSNECKSCSHNRYLKRSEGTKRFYNHGFDTKRNKIYQCWADMKTRCNCITNANYPNYGGRGIKVCKEWEDFGVFFKDIGERPEGLTLERVDNEAGYSKENCIWAYRTTQNRNKRGCVNYLVPKEGRGR